MEYAVTIIGTCATVFASLVALWVATRQNIPRLETAAYFDPYTSDDLEKKREEEGFYGAPYFIVCATNAGAIPISIIGLIDKASFKASKQGIKALIRGLHPRGRIASTGLGYGASFYPRKGEYFYPLKKSSDLISFSRCEMRFNCDHIRHIQKKRVEADFFNLEKQLKLYLVDISGKRYKVKKCPQMSPNSLLDNETCRMIPIENIFVD